LGNDKLVEMIISSIAYHHWRENFEKYITGNIDLERFCRWFLENEIKDKLKSNLQQEVTQLLNSGLNDELKDFIDDLNPNENLLKEIKNGVKLYNIAIPPYKFDYEPVRESISQSIEDTKKWILISGFLQRCDHFASWCEEENESFDKVEIECVNISDVKNNIKSEIKQKTGISDEQQIWQFSKVKDYINKDLILIAPTGYGKTEFAFLWSADKKFIYTLPLRSAVNQIYDRSLKIFGNDKVGLLHSDADIYLIEKRGDVGDNIKLYELSKNLSFPVIISTGDQFFPYALKPPGYEKIFSLFSYSNLVIDEVQAYNPRACAIIVKFIEWVKIIGGNFLLMTATMPEFVKKILEEKNIQYEEINIYEEEKQKFEEIVKHKIKFEFIENEGNEFKIPEEILNRVISEAQNGKRILFILNTVKQAQEVYKKIKEIMTIKNTPIKLFLLHSRFTLEDRRSKEIGIIEKEFKNPKPENEKEGKILVTTQVVEASLDVDADVLFTEICPLDALVQRMGRVLRRIGANFEFYRESNEKRFYKDNNGKIYEVDLSVPNVYILVFENGKESGEGRVYDRELLDLSVRKLESLKENSFMLSEYKKYEIVKSFYKSLSESSFYLKEFYETLEVLSVGYMSNRKTEAERIFREIHDIQIISENKLDDFIEEIKKTNWDSVNFTIFKKDILSKFIVSVPYFNVDEEDWVFYKIQEKLTDKKIDEKNLEKLKRWLCGIFVSQRYLYDNEKGAVILDKNERVMIV
ncbi:MAG: CRISPR-associated helicase Cas3', partial [Candidatus Omnitrophica bacterium]|nr:CRISPR-associated helicase Cas3' [Candidatus Omnitrophota bacterium]